MRSSDTDQCKSQGLFASRFRKSLRNHLVRFSYRLLSVLHGRCHYAKSVKEHVTRALDVQRRACKISKQRAYLGFFHNPHPVGFRLESNGSRRSLCLIDGTSLQKREGHGQSETTMHNGQHRYHTTGRRSRWSFRRVQQTRSRTSTTTTATYFDSKRLVFVFLLLSPGQCAHDLRFRICV